MNFWFCFEKVNNVLTCCLAGANVQYLSIYSKATMFCLIFFFFNENGNEDHVMGKAHGSWLLYLKNINHFNNMTKGSV